MPTVQTTHAPMNGIAAGWALSAVLVVLFAICVALALLWPTSAFGQGWQMVLATLPGARSRPLSRPFWARWRSHGSPPACSSASTTSCFPGDNNKSEVHHADSC